MLIDILLELFEREVEITGIYICIRFARICIHDAELALEVKCGCLCCMRESWAALRLSSFAGMARTLHALMYVHKKGRVLACPVDWPSTTKCQARIPRYL